MIRISNPSAGVTALGYALNPENQIVWLDLAPEHPKRVEAIWAEMVDGGGSWLRITDKDLDRPQEPLITLHCRGLHHRYHRLTADAPDLVDGRARPKMVRLIAPELCGLEDVQQPFGVIQWPGASEKAGIAPGTALAAALEHHTSLPIQIGWGDYLLAEAIRLECAQPLITGGTGPVGYWLAPVAWETIISEGIRAGHITLDGQIQRMPVDIPVLNPAQVTV